jgi:hypothetical protein
MRSGFKGAHLRETLRVLPQRVPFLHFVAAKIVYQFQLQIRLGTITIPSLSCRSATLGAIFFTALMARSLRSFFDLKLLAICVSLNELKLSSNSTTDSR